MHLAYLAIAQVCHAAPSHLRKVETHLNLTNLVVELRSKIPDQTKIKLSVRFQVILTDRHSSLLLASLLKQPESGAI